MEEIDSVMPRDVNLILSLSFAQTAEALFIELTLKEQAVGCVMENWEDGNAICISKSYVKAVSAVNVNE